MFKLIVSSSSFNAARVLAYLLVRHTKELENLKKVLNKTFRYGGQCGGVDYSHSTLFRELICRMPSKCL